MPPRQLNSGIPLDLDTIVLKCLEKGPQRRYPTARELADELERFLAGHPIQARRIGRAERGWRWCKRNRAVASLASAALVLMVVGTAVSTFFYFREAALGVELSQCGEELEKKTKALTTSLEATKTAERAQREETLEAVISTARAKRFGGRVGQRFDTIEAIRKATALARELDKPAAVFDELRDLAVAALALTDFKEAAVTLENGWPEGSVGLDFDPVALRTYARGDQQGNISVRRVDDDDEVARLPGAGKSRSIIFGADGRTLLLHDQENMALERWTIGGPAPETVTTISNDVYRWQQSRDGRRLLVHHKSQQGTWAEVIDVHSGLRCLEHRPTYADPALSPDGHWLAYVDGAYGTPDGNRVLLIDVETGKTAGSLLNRNNVGSPAWHPDSRTLAVGSDGNDVYVWDAPTGKLLHTLDDQKGGGAVVNMSLSGQLLQKTSSWWWGQVFWHPHTGKPLLRTPYNYPLTSTVQDGRQFEYAIDKTRITLRVVEPSPVFRVFVPDPAGPEKQDGRMVAVHPAGRLMAFGHTNGVSLFDLPTGLEVGRLDLGPNLFARFDPSNGDLLTYGPRGLFRWAIQIAPSSPDTIVIGPPRLLGPGSVAMDAGFDVSHDGRVIVVANYTHAVVYRQEGTRLSAITLAPLVDARWVQVSPDGCWAIAGRWDGIVWDAQTGQSVAAKIPMGIFTNDSKWLMAGRQRWNVGTWEQGPPLPVAEGPGALTFSPDGKIFAGPIDDESVGLVDAVTGNTLVRLGAPDRSRYWNGAFSPDGTRLVLQAVDHMCVFAWDLRLLRRHLADLGLDWEAPPFPPIEAEEPGPRKVPHIEIIDPTKAIGDLTLGDQQAAAGDHQAALASYTRGLATIEQFASNDPIGIANQDLLYRAYNNIGNLQQQLGDYQAALASHTKALPIAERRAHDDPASIENQTYVGGTYCNIGNAESLAGRADDAVRSYDRAAETLQAILKREPEHALTRLFLRNACWGRATTLGRLNRHAEACESWQKAVELDAEKRGDIRAGYAESLNTLAWSLAARPEAELRDPPRAIELATKSIELNPNSMVAFNTLGVAQYRLGNWQAAVEALDQSVKLRAGGDAFDRFFLAMSHQRLGNQDEARKWYDQAVEWTEKQTAPNDDLIRFRGEAEELFEGKSNEQASGEKRD